MAKSMARNLVFFRRLLIDNPMPQDESGISQNVAPGAVDLKGDNSQLITKRPDINPSIDMDVPIQLR